MGRHLLTLFTVVIVYCTLTGIVQSAPAVHTIQVNNTAQLYKAVNQANHAKGATSIVLADGRYNLNQRLSFSGSHIKLTSRSGDPTLVILSGQGMRKTPSAEILIDVSGSDISLSGVTLQQSANHLIQVRAEKNADNFSLSNCVLRDSYEQLLKVSSSPSSKAFADNGSIKNCVFEYSAGVGPQFYIGGIDAHSSRNWTIVGNTFRNIASPSQHVAEHAIHFWRKSANITVLNNTIENCDRGIGFGLGKDVNNQTVGGLIANNSISNSNPLHQFADVGIAIEASPNIEINNNKIIIEGHYPNAIEYRFAATKNVVIKNNVTNKSIVSRDGGQAELSGNQQANVLSQVKQNLEYLIERF
ncbi:MAG: right-handed parallel beta-helix repeat-containing protein [Paraglaciecola sp.]|uniref:right-handed parallel beta-helix repeat-containing protein n=1 Tax=Paraglaciecola sp. TaxID=1920173 RepID=UPI00329A1D9B